MIVVLKNVRQAARLLLDLAELKHPFLLRDQESQWRRSEPDGFHSVPILSSRLPWKYFRTSEEVIIGTDVDRIGRAKVNWHTAYQIAMTICYVALSVRLVQLILAFRGE